uniref:Transposase Tc1-like domain-containing protein n=1 Tax=Esox lucius TaxID=8010 RepID=A0AAY5K4A2_ESOLU
MVRRELPKHQRDLIVERYQSGEGYKIISKALDMPWNTVTTVIIKLRKYGTTDTSPRTGHPSKIDEKTKRKLIREASKRPTATLKELQEFMASTGCVLHVTTISRILHMNGLWVGWQDGKPFLTKKNIQARLKFAKPNIKSLKACGKMCYGLMKPRFNFLAIIPKEEEWANIATSRCAMLTDCYPKRLNAVIKSKGASTKYLCVLMQPGNCEFFILYFPPLKDFSLFFN